MRQILFILVCLFASNACSQTINKANEKLDLATLKKTVIFYTHEGKKVNEIEAEYFWEIYELDKKKYFIQEFKMNGTLVMKGDCEGLRKKKLKYNGLFIYYHPNGAIKYEGRYFRGTKGSQWLTYNKHGKLVRKSMYDDFGRYKTDYVADESENKQNKPIEDERPDIMPEFEGGAEKMTKYIVDNFKYPRMSVKMGQRGTVYCEFLIKEDGSISDVKIVKGVSDFLDDEVVRIVTEMPDWTPGYTNGKPVKTKFTIPIKYQ